ncbi:MAG: helix-turn-helix domain-containing protein [Lachnospiraceae bacterium]|nr:helix-turn-helix domain-containing protein [Lachnospiraceae bacterium]
MLTVDEVSNILRISRRSVMRLFADGTISYKKIGRHYRISKSAVLKYLNFDLQEE